MGRPTAVIAFGGNALLKQSERGTQDEQTLNAQEAAAMIADVAGSGYTVLLVHGNGPQVGNILIQMEEASARIPPFSLDVCVAMSQGSMGFMLELALRNEYLKRGLDADVVTVDTLVEVDPDDPRMQEPTKPIGPFYPKFQAAVMKDEKGWAMVEDSGRGFRRVVASPYPRRVLQARLIRRLLEEGCTVIAAGGGGIPVVRDGKGHWRGAEAVIDKDYAAGLLAVSLRAELFVILTFARRVAIRFGKPDQLELDRLSVRDAEAYLKSGEFPPGSMGPKVEAVVGYVKATGKAGLITAPHALPAALKGSDGTWIVP